MFRRKEEAPCITKSRTIAQSIREDNRTDDFSSSGLADVPVTASIHGHGCRNRHSLVSQELRADQLVVAPAGYCRLEIYWDNVSCLAASNQTDVVNSYRVDGAPLLTSLKPIVATVP